MSQNTNIDNSHNAVIGPVYDVVIIGGGPAGMTASMWCIDLGLTSIIIDAVGAFGGQLLSIYTSINNYPGVLAPTGSELAEIMSSRSTVGGEYRLDQKVDRITIDPLGVGIGEECWIGGRSIIIATGLRRRKLDIPGEDRYSGNGILLSGVRDRELVLGRRVAVIGGGDSAVENALILADTAAKVLVIHRRNEFTSRKAFLDKVRSHPNIEIITDAVVDEIMGNERVTGLRLNDRRTGARYEIEIDSVLVRIGYQPNSEFAADVVRCDPAGFILANARCETSEPAIYAIGDVVRSEAPTIAGAVGDGATAVKNIYTFFETGERL